MLHRTICNFVRLINDIDRGLSYFMLFSMYIIGSALIGVIGHLIGFNSWFWTEAMLNPEMGSADRIGLVAFVFGQVIVLSLWFFIGYFYQRAGESRYRAALAKAGDGATGGLGYGLGYWTYSVNGRSACSRFAPRT